MTRERHDHQDDDLERRLRSTLRGTHLSIEPDADALQRIHVGARRRQQRRVAASAGAAMAVVGLAAGAIVLTPGAHNSPEHRTLVSPNPSVRQIAPETSPATTSPPVESPSASQSASPTPSFTVSTAPTTPAGQQPPAGFVPMSVTATTMNGNTYLVLGHAPCAAGTCTALVKTTDGGKTFTTVGAPPAQLVPDAPGNNDVFGQNTISDIRFVDANNGWAFGGALWQTTDGGKTWARAAIPGSVQQLAVASGRAWAIVFTDASATGAGPTYRVFSATYPDDTWLPADSAGTFGPAEPVLALQGTQATVLGGNLHAVTAVSGPASFTSTVPPPCTPSGGTESPLSPTTGALWLACPDGGTSGVYVLRTGDTSWSTAAAQLSGKQISVGAVDAMHAIVGIDGKLLRYYSDPAATSVPAASAPTPVAYPSVPASTVWPFIGFTNNTDGFAVAIVNGTRQLWRTTDAGSTWSIVKF